MKQQSELGRYLAEQKNKLYQEEEQRAKFLATLFSYIPTKSFISAEEKEGSTGIEGEKP